TGGAPDGQRGKDSHADGPADTVERVRPRCVPQRTGVLRDRLSHQRRGKGRTGPVRSLPRVPGAPSSIEPVGVVGGSAGQSSPPGARVALRSSGRLAGSAGKWAAVSATGGVFDA